MGTAGDVSISTSEQYIEQTEHVHWSVRPSPRGQAVRETSSLAITEVFDFRTTLRHSACSAGRHRQRRVAPPPRRRQRARDCRQGDEFSLGRATPRRNDFLSTHQPLIVLRDGVERALRGRYQQDSYLFPAYNDYCFGYVPDTVRSVLNASGPHSLRSGDCLRADVRLSQADWRTERRAHATGCDRQSRPHDSEIKRTPQSWASR